ncbi:hypothetical protein [Bacillus horti]|uniref:Anti-sigma-YlaC factor YlaD n=1 Tax=Caldalkalibacillus horti TaxID=77523 RepID=A0ABT9W4P5_9BACI|nr:hypothetical protein [Bacillus horti]MDQ0167820.1 putative anti-sigma-YlaC factor YlaD [Bacillus horti]
MKCNKSLVDWEEFVRQESSNFNDKRLEQHLANCPACLKKYEQALSNSYVELESLYGQSPDLSANIMTMIEASSKQSLKKSPQIVRQKSHHTLTKSAMFHYVFAASIAFLLYQAGIFNHIFSYSEHYQVATTHSTEWLEQIKQSTSHWVSQISKMFR